MSFELENTSYPYCQAYWDEGMKKYRNDSFEKTLECCMKNSADSEEGRQNCLIQIPRRTKTFIRCADNIGEMCGYYPNYNKECLKENKDILRTCCRNNCVSVENVDCENMCNFAYKFFTEEHGNAKNTPQNSLVGDYIEMKFKPRFSVVMYTMVLFVLFGIFLTSFFLSKSKKGRRT